MKLNEIYTSDHLTTTALNMLQIAQTEWIEIMDLHSNTVFPDKILMRIKVENNDFIRPMQLVNGTVECVALPVSALASDEEMKAFWKLANEMHAETRDEAIERRLKALEAKMEIK